MRNISSLLKVHWLNERIFFEIVYIYFEKPNFNMSLTENFANHFGSQIKYR